MVTEEISSFNSIFYIVIISIIVIIGLIVFFIKKLRYNSRKILKSIWVSLSITAIIEIVLLIIYSIIGGGIYCKMGGNCPTKLEMFLISLPYTIIPIFLLTLFIYYLIKFFRRKK